MTMLIESAPVSTHVELSEFCQEHLSSLSRSDQRRWGEVYIRGLAFVPGRKSIKRISDYIVGWRADQCLQQFINQSTWQWEPVRRSLAHTVAGLLRPRAWVITEAVFPKNGSNSVGVARQYAPSAGRVLNCQLGLAVSLTGDFGSCPVNWRLQLPPSWDDDPARRSRARLPDSQRHRPRWCSILDAVEEMILAWDLPMAPVIVDATDEPDVEFLLRGLEERDIPYVVQVPGHTPAGYRRAGSMTVGELATGAIRPGATTLKVRTRNERSAAVSRFVATPVPGEPEVARIRAGRLVRRPRHLLAQWTLGLPRPAAVWLTNLSVSRVPELIELVDLVSLRGRAAADLVGLQDEVGLRHFEGRSYRGWHHHVTLASVAGAYQLMRSGRPASA
jgi:SRSO17 transposase